MSDFPPILRAFLGACLFSLIYTWIAAAIWGHNGPLWSIYPLIGLACLGAVLGWLHG